MGSACMVALESHDKTPLYAFEIEDPSIWKQSRRDVLQFE